MHRFAAVSLLVAGAQATAPTASPFPECPVNILITTDAPTAAPSKSPTAAPTFHPTASPTTSAPTGGDPSIGFTPVPDNTGIQNSIPVSWGAPNFGPGPCRCDIFDAETQPFLDRNDTYCGNKHAGMLAAWEGAVHFTCPSCVQSGTSINITCPNDWETCELLLNLYVCPGCSSNGAQTTTGMWPSSLATDGWVAAGRCTGDWCEEYPSTKQHPFVGFHKQILGGDTEMIPETASDPTMYFSLLVKEGKVCGDINDMTQCQQAPLCHWSSTNNNCYQDWCPSLGGNNVPPSCAPNCAPGTPDGTCHPTASAPSP